MLLWKTVSLFSPSWQNIQESVSISRKPPLFVSPGGIVYAPYPFLLCAHLLRFQSIPPRRLLSPSIVPITYSAQSLRPPTAEVNLPPPPERNDWQVCGVNNIHSHNRSAEERKYFFPQKTDKSTEKMSRAVKREDIIFIMACLCGWSFMEFIIFGSLPQLIFVHHFPDTFIKHWGIDATKMQWEQIFYPLFGK